MPTFLEQRKRNPWRGKVKRKGFGEEDAYFPTRDEALEWEEMRRGALRRKAKGVTADIADLSKITVGKMVDQYLKEETAHKASCREETYTLHAFLEHKDFKTRPLIAFTRPDAVEYRNYLERDYRCEGKVYIRNGKTFISNRRPRLLKLVRLDVDSLSFETCGTLQRRIREDTDEVEEQIPEAFSNVSPFIRKQASKQL